MLAAFQLKSYGDLHTIEYSDDSLGMTVYSNKDPVLVNDAFLMLKDMRPSELKAVLRSEKFIKPPTERQKTPGHEYAKAPGAFDLAKRFFDLCEDIAPQSYNGSNRAKVVGIVADALNKFPSLAEPPESLPDIAFPEEGDAKKRFDHFFEEGAIYEKQKRLMQTEYGQPPVGKLEYIMPVEDVNGEQLKIIDQNLYDRAVVQGFSNGFFRNAYFSSVTFYALPEKADFSASVLQDCKFNVCAARGATFNGSSVYSTDFQTVDLTGASFSRTTLAHTHFNAVDLRGVDFSDASVRNCNFTSCNMWDVSLLCTKLNNVSFAKIEDPRIAHIMTTDFHFGAVEHETAKILMEKALRELGQLPAEAPPANRVPKKPPEPAR